MTVKEISQRAKKIRAKYPTKKWTDCIKQASKELKSGKVGTTKKVAKAPVKNSTTLKAVNDEARELSFKLRNKIYVMRSNNTLYTSVGKGKGTVLSIWDMGNKIGATKSVQAKRTRSGMISKPTVSKHKDTMSHNVRINVLSGLGGKPVPLVLNGVTRVTKGAFYLLQYPDGEISNKTIFKYIKKLSTGALIFDVYQKGKTGGYNKPIQYQFPETALMSLVRTKKPTAKELAIGHLKLMK